MFNWATLRELGPEALPFKTPVQGMRCAIQLTTGESIDV